MWCLREMETMRYEDLVAVAASAPDRVTGRYVSLNFFADERRAPSTFAQLVWWLTIGEKGIIELVGEGGTMRIVASHPSGVMAVIDSPEDTCKEERPAVLRVAPDPWDWPRSLNCFHEPDLVVRFCELPVGAVILRRRVVPTAAGYLPVLPRDYFFKHGDNSVTQYVSSHRTFMDTYVKCPVFHAPDLYVLK